MSLLSKLQTLSKYFEIECFNLKGLQYNLKVINCFVVGVNFTICIWSSSKHEIINKFPRPDWWKSFSKRIYVSSGGSSSKGGLTNSRLSLMALLAKVSASSTRVSLIWSPLLLVSQESISPMIAGQKGRHSWLSIEERLTIKRDSCSQTIRQKSQIVLSRGCWVTMNSRRSKKPEKYNKNRYKFLNKFEFLSFK